LAIIPREMKKRRAVAQPLYYLHTCCGLAVYQISSLSFVWGLRPKREVATVAMLEHTERRQG
jgi:hypothetical protein